MLRRAILVGLVGLVAGPGAAAAAPAPWRSADAVQDRVEDAQTELLIGSRAGAADAVDRAERAWRALRSPFARTDPAATRAGDEALAAAREAVRRDDDVALAGAKGALRGAVRRGAYAVTLAAAAAGDAGTVRAWLLVREFRTATRFTRPGTSATEAADGLAAGDLTPAAARAAIAKDLLDAYQGRLEELLDDSARGIARELPARRAEAAAQAAGHFEILAGRYREDRGPAALARARAAYTRLAARGDEAALAAARAALEDFTAAPLTAEESARRAQQLLQFLALVSVEYERGVDDTTVTKDFEIQEAVAFQQGADAALTDLASDLQKRDATRAADARTGLAELGALVDDASTDGSDVAPSEQVEDVAAAVEGDLRATMPEAWLAETDESDYDLIALTLDRLEAAAGAGQYPQAEQARLEAYAFFEFGPERRLRAFDPGLALEVEELMWFGNGDAPGLAKLIADRQPLRDIRDTRVALDQRLADSAATLGDGASRATVVTNSAIIVFREGLEAVLILAAITASFVGARRRLRRPVLIGAIGGLLASAVTWVLAQTVLESLDQYGEKLEAIVGLIAVAVLLLITNWFFHKVYWSEWIGRFHRQRKRYEKMDKRGFFSGQAIGLGVLGLTSVYREGFETVLFLQSLELSAGAATVLEGAGLGLLATLAVAVVTFKLQRKLPYKRMLIVTGVFIGFVLVVMVGQTARTLQGTGWLSITPVEIELPYWLGLWFGVHPTVETLGAQFIAMVFVIGSYFLAEEVRVRRPRRRARAAAATGPVGADGASVRRVGEVPEEGATEVERQAAQV